jgi:hypothetical protein
MAMSFGEIVLWIAIIISPIMLMAYEIWNFIVVAKDFSRLSREAKEQKGIQ